MSALAKTTAKADSGTQKFSPAHSGLLQRKCACGSSPGISGECTECQGKRLQRKLTIGSSNDPLEAEADRVADQVLAAPAHSKVSSGPPRIQRFTGQATGDAGTAPAIVEHVLSSAGKPFEPALRQDMEQRFGHDFSNVRVHSGAAAEQSAWDVNASAYTVGHDIVFGVGRFAPETHEGRRLLAHELAHVVQQSGVEGNWVSQSNEKNCRPPIFPKTVAAMNGPGPQDGHTGEIIVTVGGGRGSQVPRALLQREPTKPRATTGAESIADLTSQTAKLPAGKVTAGSLARQEWESLFKRHFTEPDKIMDEVESSHARYIYSQIYGWIDAQHFFAHIQFAEESGLQGATEKGIAIEQKQQLVRSQISPGPGDPLGYTLLFENNLISPEALLHYHDELVIAFGLAKDAVLSKQERELIKDFSDEQLTKLLLDNAMSAWSYEDLISNQLGVQFFGRHGDYVNGGGDASEVRRRFIDKITEYFAAIRVVNDPATVKSLGAKLPGKERWTSPKMSEAQARKKFPELFAFGVATHRIRIAIYNTKTRAEKGREDVAKVVSTGRGLYVAPYGSNSYALYTGRLSHFEALLLKWAIDHAIQTGPGGALVELQPTEAPIIKKRVYGPEE